MNTAVKHPQHILAIKKSFITEFLNSDKSVNHADFSNFFEEANEHLVIARRQELESNEEYLQILPYAVVTRLSGNIYDSADKMNLLTYHRPVSGGESRLHGNTSIGFGGHIDLNDIVTDENSVINLHDTVLISMHREICEELGVSTSDIHNTTLSYRLITHYSGEPVHKVHLGIVFIVVLTNNCEIYPEVIEIDYAGEFTAADLIEMEKSGEIQMEAWSRLIAEEISSDPGLGSTGRFCFPEEEILDLFAR